MPGNEDLYKTVLCNNYSRYGDCRYSHKCQFAHGIEELRERPSYCPPASRSRALPPGPPRPRYTELVHLSKDTPRLSVFQNLTEKEYTPRLPVFRQNLKEYAGKKKKKQKEKDKFSLIINIKIIIIIKCSN